MTQIHSHHNPRLKALRKLATKRGRATTGQFMAEGEDLLAAAVAAGRAPVEGFRLTGLEGPDPAPPGASGFHEVEAAALHAASSLGSGARVIGVYAQQWAARPRGPLCVYLHGVSDPGNVGTILRSAQAFGASCVALGPGCSDPHSPKAVRASMGAVFSVPLARARSLTELPGERIGLAAGAAEVLSGPAAGELTLLVGAEREGLPEEVLELCERCARIPIASESLNAAMAATVALYEMTRKPSRVPAS